MRHDDDTEERRQKERETANALRFERIVGKLEIRLLDYRCRATYQYWSREKVREVTVSSPLPKFRTDRILIDSC